MCFYWVAHSLCRKLAFLLNIMTFTNLYFLFSIVWDFFFLNSSPKTQLQILTHSRLMPLSPRRSRTVRKHQTEDLIPSLYKSKVAVSFFLPPTEMHHRLLAVTCKISWHYNNLKAEEKGEKFSKFYENGQRKSTVNTFRGPKPAWRSCLPFIIFKVDRWEPH